MADIMLDLNLSLVALLLIGYLINNVPGIIVGTAAVAAGVFSEAMFIGWRVQPVLRNQLRNAPPVPQTLTLVTHPFGSARLDTPEGSDRIRMAVWTLPP